MRRVCLTASAHFDRQMLGMEAVNVFCPQCGSKNVDNAVFCENCGVNITAALHEALQKARQNTPTTGSHVATLKARKPLKTSAKVTLGVVAAVFVAVQRQKASDEKIVSYELSPDPWAADLSNAMGPSPKNTGSQWKNVEIDYLIKGSSSPQTQDFTLVKQPEMKWLFFDTWKISTDRAYNLVTPKVTILAPADVTVSFGDVQLGNKYLVKGNDSSNNNPYELATYTVKKVFAGHYTIKATSPITEDYIHLMDIGESDSTFVISRKDLKLKQSILDTVAKQPGDVVKALYSAALAGKNFDSVSSLFVTDSGNQDSLRNEYSEIKALFSKGARGGFKSIDFTSFKPEVDSGSSDPENIVFNTAVKYSYTAAPGSSADRALYTGSDSSAFRMKFRNVKGKWLVAEMSDVCLSWRNGYSAN